MQLAVRFICSIVWLLVHAHARTQIQQSSDSCSGGQVAKRGRALAQTKQKRFHMPKVADLQLKEEDSTTCTCDTPNAGTAGHNKYTCTDGHSAWCATWQECFASHPFPKGKWKDGCSITCKCDDPYSQWPLLEDPQNYKCTDGKIESCKRGWRCSALHAFRPEQRSDACTPIDYDSKPSMWGLLTQMIPNNPVTQKDAPHVQKEVRLSAMVTTHDAADAKTMQRAESLKTALGADFKGTINEVLLESFPALRPMESSRPIKVVDRGDGRHVVADGNGRVQAMKLAFVDHSVVNVDVDEVELKQNEKEEFLKIVPTLRGAIDDQVITKALVDP